MICFVCGRWGHHLAAVMTSPLPLSVSHHHRPLHCLRLRFLPLPLLSLALPSAGAPGPLAVYVQVMCWARNSLSAGARAELGALSMGEGMAGGGAPLMWTNASEHFKLFLEDYAAGKATQGGRRSSRSGRAQAPPLSARCSVRTRRTPNPKDPALFPRLHSLGLNLVARFPLPTHPALPSLLLFGGQGRHLGAAATHVWPQADKVDALPAGCRFAFIGRVEALVAGLAALFPPRDAGPRDEGADAPPPLSASPTRVGSGGAPAPASGATPPHRASAASLASPGLPSRVRTAPAAVPPAVPLAVPYGHRASDDGCKARMLATFAPLGADEVRRLCGLLEVDYACFGYARPQECS